MGLSDEVLPKSDNGPRSISPRLAFAVAWAGSARALRHLVSVNNLVLGLAAVAILAWLSQSYGADAWYTGDAPDYLDLEPHRPVGYGAFLRLVQALGLTPKLRFLPQIQAVLLVGTLALFAGAVGRALSSLTAGLLVLLLPWTLPSFVEAPPSIGTEALFMATVLGAATLCLTPRPGRRSVLLGIGACHGGAVLLRTAGWAVVPAALLFLSLGAGLPARRLLLPLAVLLGLWLAGGAVQAGLAGRLVPHTFGAVSLAGKGALLARCDADLPAGLHGLPEVAAEARALIAAAPHAGLRARLRFQAYEDLRWRWIWPRAEAALPGWNQADASSWPPRVGPVAIRMVRADPLGYGRLVLEDYLSLFTWPEMALPGTLAADRAFLAAQPRRTIVVQASLESGADAWPVLPLQPRWPLWMTLLPFSLLALPLSLAVLTCAAAAALDLAPSSPAAVSLLSALLLQAQAVATALAEAGLLRYAAPLAPFVVALTAAVLLALVRYLKALPRAQRGRRNRLR